MGHKYLPFNLLTCCIYTLLLITCVKSSLNDTEDEFVHLLQRTGDNKRIHITSELVRNGHQLQIEEYLDLETWNQFIQFKWHQDPRGLSANKGLNARKLYVVIINNATTKQMIQYEPYKCKSKTLTKTDGGLDWRVSMANSVAIGEDDQNVSADGRFNLTINTILSQASNNFYLSQFKAPDNNEVWIFGVLGAWLKAQYPGQNNKPPMKDKLGGGHWTINLEDSEVSVDYYFDDQSLMSNDNKLSGKKVKTDLLNMIEVKSLISGVEVDLINVIDIDFSYDDQLAEDLFKLPIGFNCESNPQVGAGKYMVLRPESSNRLLELEIIASKFMGLQDRSLYSQTETKTITLVNAVNAMNLSSSLLMFHDHEDRFKIIHDYHSKIKYSTDYRKSGQKCAITKLDSSALMYVPFRNGIRLVFNDKSLNYLLDDGHGNEMFDEWRLLNRINVNPSLDELVFEKEFPQSLQSLVDMTNRELRYIAPSISVIRIFEQPISYLKSNGTKNIKREGPLLLTRLTLIIYDSNRENKFAEVRININKRIHRMSLQRKAKLFDLSQCYNLGEESLQLVASYPVEPNLLDYALDVKHEVIENFYFQAAQHLSFKSDNSRLASSLNFLRVPKIEVSGSPDGDLELKLTILDKLSLKYLFDRLPESTLSDNLVTEELLIQSDLECAMMCQHYNCLMFAYESDGLVCKLSHTQYVDRFSISKPSTRMTLSKISSSVYYRRENLGNQGASLFELYSYLEHSASNELETYLNQSSQGETQENDTKLDREKRDTLPIKLPLMSIQVTDRSKGEYAIPETKNLIPSKIKLLKLQTFFEVDTNSASQKVKMAFETKFEGKKYKLTALDNDVIIDSDERSFHDHQNSVYYTGKVFKSKSLDFCQNACYDIDERDLSSSSQRTCISFSYCSYERQCLIMVKTDENYTNNLLDIANEGEVVPSLESLDQIITRGHGCIIASRLSINDFDGPLELADYSRYLINDEFGVDIEYEWLRVFSSEGGISEKTNLESCSRDCYNRNKLGNRCLGFDYCVLSKQKEFDSVNCYLLLTKENRADIKSKTFSDNLKKLRSQFTQLETRKAKIIPNTKCHRYVTSNLREFTHLKRRGFPDFLLQNFKINKPSIDNLNLDSCALQCVLEDTDCLAFQFCSSTNPDTNQLERNCTLIGGLKNSAPTLMEVNQNNLGLTRYNNECHTYVRKEFKTIEDLYANAYENLPRISDYSTLIVTFSVAYGVVLVLIALFVISKRRGLRLFGPLENMF